MPEGLGNKKGEGEGGRERKAKVLKSPKSTGERWECGAGLGTLAGPPWAASPEQAALAAEVEPVWFGREPDLRSRSQYRAARGQRGTPGALGCPGPRCSALTRKGHSCPLPPPLWIRSAFLWRGKEGESRAGGRREHPHTPVSPQSAVPCLDAWPSPSTGTGCSPARPVKAIKISSPYSGSPSPSLSQTRGTSASAEGPGDGPRIFNF